MRYTEQKDLSFCLTVSTGIELHDLLNILGRKDVLSEPQTFDDFIERRNRTRQSSLINVFEEGDFLITVENSGFMGVSTAVMLRMSVITTELGHYASVYRNSLDGGGYRYVEVQDGMILANFNPLLDEAPPAIDQFFSGPLPGPTGPAEMTKAMIEALEYRMEIQVQPKWLEQPTDTYIIDYKTLRV